MTENNRKSKVYTTRVPNDLADRLDVYIQNSEATKSKTVKELLEVGLQIEELDGTPEEQKRLINDLEEEIRELEAEVNEERSKRVQYQAAGAIMTAPMIGLLVFAGFVDLIRDRLGISVEATNQIVGFAILIVVVGGLFYLVLLLLPYVLRARERLGI